MELTAQLTCEDKEGLRDEILSRAKGREAYRVGVEFEFFGIERDSRLPLAYAGERGIERLFAMMVERGWHPQLEGERAIALEKDGSNISLEPGGQVELSGAPFADMAGVEGELKSVVGELADCGDALGLGFYQAGMQPFFTGAEIPWVPKGRYGVMKAYLPERGHLAHLMMKETGGVQVNLDFSSEADLARKFRLASRIAPLSSAMFANSAISAGAPNGWQSRRVEIWRHTDPARCGLIPSVFADEFTVADYVDYAMSVPMMFLYRDGQYLPMHGMSFCEFVKGGHPDHKATFQDWELHLSGIFTEIRLKGYLEIRTTDGAPAPWTLAMPAFWKGLIYSDAALDGLEAMTEGWTFEEVDALLEPIAREGTRASFRGQPVSELIERLLALAHDGLPDDERRFLQPLIDLMPGTLADRQLERWPTWSQDTDAFLADNGIRRHLS